MELEQRENLKRNWLSSILEHKSNKNPNFSLRALAKQINVSPSTISRVINAKRPLTLKMALHIANTLELDQDDKEYIYSLYSKVSSKNTTSLLKKQISLDAFEVISDWYHYGLTQLITTSYFRNDTKWIAKHLEITQIQVQQAINRLTRLNLIYSDNGTLKRTTRSFYTISNTPSKGLRKFQKQILEKAIISLEKDCIDERDITSITVATDSKNLPLVKKEIESFRKKMASLLPQGTPDRIYNLGIHLIPISKKINGEPT